MASATGFAETIEPYPARVALAMASRAVRRVIPVLGEGHELRSAGLLVRLADYLASGEPVDERDMLVREDAEFSIKILHVSAIRQSVMALRGASRNLAKLIDRVGRGFLDEESDLARGKRGTVRVDTVAAWERALEASQASPAVPIISNGVRLMDPRNAIGRAMEHDLKTLSRDPEMQAGGWLGLPVDPGPLGPFGTLWPGMVIPDTWPMPPWTERGAHFTVLDYEDFLQSPWRRSCDAVCWTIRNRTDLDEAPWRLARVRQEAAPARPVIIVNMPTLDEEAARRMAAAGAVVFRGDFPGIGPESSPIRLAGFLDGSFRAMQEDAFPFSPGYLGGGPTPREELTMPPDGGLSDEYQAYAPPDIVDSGPRSEEADLASHEDGRRAYRALFERCEAAHATLRAERREVEQRP